jgi:hypothetical protein
VRSLILLAEENNESRHLDSCKNNGGAVGTFRKIPTGFNHSARRWTTESAYAGWTGGGETTLKGLNPSGGTVMQLRWDLNMQLRSKTDSSPKSSRHKIQNIRIRIKI